ncbi:MAG: hypothetical protein FJW61_05715 [Actinobacteria bacterium]|nr:hypothetical protein [Actinomycetota bacterium]
MNNENMPSINNLVDILKEIKKDTTKEDLSKNIDDEKKAIMTLFDEIDKLKLYIKVTTEELLIKKIGNYSEDDNIHS